MTEERSAQAETDRSAPLISVIVPIYNTEKYLPHCIESILAQSYRHLEIILVDDGSPDRCGAICDEYARHDKRILVIHKENGGLSSARNCGLDHCNGEYISFIDSDDFVSPYFIEILYRSIIQFDSDIASLRPDKIVNFLDEAENSIQLAQNALDFEAQLIMPREAIQQIFYARLSTGFPNHLFRREIYREFRLPVGWLYEDTATIHRTFMLAERVSAVDARVYAYRLRQDGIMRMKFSEKKMVAIQVAEQVASDARAYDVSLIPAAYSRAFALVYSVFTQVPASNREAMKKLWHSMLLYRDIVARNRSPQARAKDRIGAWCTYLGMHVSYLLGRVYRVINTKRMSSSPTQ